MYVAPELVRGRARAWSRAVDGQAVQRGVGRFGQRSGAAGQVEGRERRLGVAVEAEGAEHEQGRRHGGRA